MPSLATPSQGLNQVVSQWESDPAHFPAGIHTKAQSSGSMASFRNHQGLFSLLVFYSTWLLLNKTMLTGTRVESQY